MGAGAAFGRIRRLGAAAALWVALLAGAAAATDCAPGVVELRGDWGRARFSVELAETAQEQAQGLMHRTEMPLSSGMYFVYPTPRSTSFWMRNTLIPLDMLFVDAAGVVTHIHSQAIPLDETPIPSQGPVLAVLEINGGLAARLGITPGSELRHPAHAAHGPAWPC